VDNYFSLAQVSEMSTMQPPHLFVQLVAQLDPQGQLVQTRELKGGVSAQVTVLTMLDGAGQTQQFVVRQHGALDRQRNPTIASDEFRLLQALQAAGIAAPQPYWVDQSGAIFGTPVLVMEYIAGEPLFTPKDRADFLGQAAAHLAQIHQLLATHPALTFLPKPTADFGASPVLLDESLQEGRIRAALARYGPLAAPQHAVLLHGDFWPGNLLWRAERLVAVIDWEDAALGDPLCDLANSRLEILWAFDAQAMTEFTAAYCAANALDLTNLPYWDLVAALRPAGKLSTWGLEPATEVAMRTKHAWFVDQALRHLR